MYSTLGKVLSTAWDCGLETVGEALHNWSLHEIQLLAYKDIPSEAAQLKQELENAGFQPDDRIDTCLELLGWTLQPEPVLGETYFPPEDEACVKSS